MMAGRDTRRSWRRVFFVLAGSGVVLGVLAVAGLLLGNAALAGALFVASLVCWLAARSLYAAFWRRERTEGVRQGIDRLESRVEEAQRKSGGKN